MPVTYEWDIFRPIYGGLRIECLVGDCHFHQDFEDTTDQKELLAIKRALIRHLILAHGIRVGAGSMRVSE